MKRIILVHGSARVEDNVSQKTIDALNEVSKKAYEYKEDDEESFEESFEEYFERRKTKAEEFKKELNALFSKYNIGKHEDYDRYSETSQYYFTINGETWTSETMDEMMPFDK